MRVCIHAGGNRGGGKPPPCIEQTGANVSGIIICKPRHYIPRNTCVSRGVFALPSSFAIEENRGMLPSLSMQPLEANKPRVVIIDWVPLLLLPVSPGLLSPRSTHPLSIRPVVSSRRVGRSSCTKRCVTIRRLLLLASLFPDS